MRTVSNVCRALYHKLLNFSYRTCSQLITQINNVADGTPNKHALTFAIFAARRLHVHDVPPPRRTSDTRTDSRARGISVVTHFNKYMACIRISNNISAHVGYDDRQIAIARARIAGATAHRVHGCMRIERELRPFVGCYFINKIIDRLCSFYVAKASLF